MPRKQKTAHTNSSLILVLLLVATFVAVGSFFLFQSFAKKSDPKKLSYALRSTSQPQAIDTRPKSIPQLQANTSDGTLSIIKNDTTTVKSEEKKQYQDLYVQAGDFYQWQFEDDLLFWLGPLPIGCADTDLSCQKTLNSLFKTYTTYGGLYLYQSDTNTITHLIPPPKSTLAFPKIEIVLTQDEVTRDITASIETEQDPGIFVKTLFLIDLKNASATQVEK